VAAGAVSVGPTVLPGGSPSPVLIVFDGGAITLSGAVPSAAAASRLSTLAEAYSKTPSARIVNNLVVDPHTPGTVGVRVIEMNAARFPTGVSVVTPDYALGLSRVVGVMKTIPTLSVLVIGHADQRGASDKNLALSQARASAVVEYLVSQGIGPDRLSARGLGDHDLLTQQSDAAGLALNRRTEFVFFGLLVGV
jgi:flagellar motor protein MotB